MTINKPLYTRLLKQKKVSRKEINKKKNLDKKRAIIRELIQWYNQDQLSPTQTLKLVRKHGIKIPKDISSNPFEFAGIRRFGKEQAKLDRRLITRIQKLKGTTIPTDRQAYPSKTFDRDMYVYIIQYWIKGISKTTIVGTDKLVSRNAVEKMFGELIRTGEFDAENWLFFISPPLGDIDLGAIESFKVVGLMRGTK